jgi:hypothetical protein
VIRHSRSTLSVYSDVRSTAEITAVLGLQPHRNAEKGDLKAAARAGRPLGSPHRAYERSHWSFQAEEDRIDPNDQTGFASLRVPVDVFREKADVLEALRSDCETIIWWSGDSDSGQGGFVMPADLLVDLARIGCDLYGTAFLHEADED